MASLCKNLTSLCTITTSICTNMTSLCSNVTSLFTNVPYLRNNIHVPSPVIFLLTVPRQCFFCLSSLSSVFRVYLCDTVLFVLCSIVVTYWERAGLLALLCVMFSCVFVTFTYCVLGQVRYLIVWIPNFCLLPYLYFYIRMWRVRLDLSHTRM